MVPRDSEAAWAQSAMQAPRRFDYRTILRHIGAFAILTFTFVIVVSSVQSGGGLVHAGVTDTVMPRSHRIKRSLTGGMQKNNGGLLVSKYANLTYIHNLDITPPPPRLFAIGDVHGCRKELDALVAKIGYDYDRGDRLILLGDLTSKGPKSLEVVRRARELNAWCVRGNHDDKVIRIATFLRSSRASAGMSKQGDKAVFPEGAVYDPIKKTNKHVDLARRLIEDEQNYAYLASCPMILTMPSLKSVFVHAGLDPAKTLEEQQPYFVMNMRTLQRDNSPAKHRKDGVRLWADSWEDVQTQGKSKTPFTKVYYGHAASSKLQLRKHSFGIDTGCVYGGELTALEVQSGRITQVSCPMYAEHD
ncbi:Metallo-dependent phosphatase-like protein [Dichotomocladium elegans]|nr:Metallo-dependent phosphatase-like protein [Dichotomocladium elegans]